MIIDNLWYIKHYRGFKKSNEVLEAFSKLLANKDSFWQ